MLWGVKLTNCLHDSINAFIEFDIGGNREEVRVESGTKTKIYVVGELKNRKRTNVNFSIKGNQPVDFGYRTTFEYRGSYLDVEEEKVKIRVSQKVDCSTKSIDIKVNTIK